MLPKGIALMRIQIDDRRYVEISRRLTADQDLAARVLACALAQDSPLVIITCAELLLTMSDAAA